MYANKTLHTCNNQCMQSKHDNVKFIQTKDDTLAITNVYNQNRTELQ